MGKVEAGQIVALKVAGAGLRDEDYLTKTRDTTTRTRLFGNSSGVVSAGMGGGGGGGGMLGPRKTRVQQTPQVSRFPFFSVLAAGKSKEEEGGGDDSAKNDWSTPNVDAASSVDASS